VYGPASTDVHNLATFGGSIQSIWKTTFSPLLTIASGLPFNITVGHDLYGTTLFKRQVGHRQRSEQAWVDPDIIWLVGSESDGR
jgi:hypothetical protein